MYCHSKSQLTKSQINSRPFCEKLMKTFTLTLAMYRVYGGLHLCHRHKQFNFKCCVPVAHKAWAPTENRDSFVISWYCFHCPKFIKLVNKIRKKENAHLIRNWDVLFNTKIKHIIVKMCIHKRILIGIVNNPKTVFNLI